MPVVRVRDIFQPTVLLALALMAVIVMMILPMPAWVLDVGLAGSFALAILIFTVTLFIERPLDFSAFPTVLLASLMLRLSLNVSSTKLIIGQGHTGTDAAGDVIEGFADFVMGGSVFLGLVVFGVLLIVNFMVITKGAARMAEVGARFALDGMPGKQLAIDSDMSAGAIDHAEARERREREQQETTFFGSLDGASKFVKGDAVAGLLITLLNLVMGLVMGTVVHGMPLATAFETYAILTVGDGLVTQIPAVVISIASALLLARGGTHGATDLALADQLGRHPAALATVAVLMVLFALVPGLPFPPFILGGAGLAATAAWMFRRDRAARSAPAAEAPPAPAERSMGEILELDDVHVEFAPDLVHMVLDPGTGLDARIANMRRFVATKFGLILPGNPPDGRPGPRQRRLCHPRPGGRAGPRPADGRPGPGARSRWQPGPAPGDSVAEPVYGAPARWIDAAAGDDAALAGTTLVRPAEVLATHLLEVIKRNFSRLLTMKSMRRLLDEMVNLPDPARAEANRKLLEEFIPDRVPSDLLHAVLRLLLAEQVSIRNLALIIEATAEGRQLHARPEAICEHVRQRLGFQIVGGLRREDGTLPLIQLAPDWEERFSTYQMEGEGGRPDVALPPEMFNALARGVHDQVTRAGEEGAFPAIVTSTLRRRFLRTVLAAGGSPTRCCRSRRSASTRARR
ncbi:MAG: FHIPEP family type III secretion protein [Roseovarius sp.]|nr:FHIPEP family type III secretion protein [Roseovarius sp.]